MIPCQTCGHEIHLRPKEEKKALQSAKVNGQGPFCDLCYHLEMASRIANHRDLLGVVDYIQSAQKLVQA